jgi:hypothetical protein
LKHCLAPGQHNAAGQHDAAELIQLPVHTTQFLAAGVTTKRVIMSSECTLEETEAQLLQLPLAKLNCQQLEQYVSDLFLWTLQQHNIALSSRASSDNSKRLQSRT